ncbi:MAG: hypothetical protein AAFO95_07855 [Cyanobacteria bacterium J06600_6]
MSTNVPEISTGQINVTVSYNPIPFVGFGVRTALRNEQNQDHQFTEETAGLAIGGEVRLFPFGATKLFDISDFSRHGFRSKARLSNSWAQNYLSGLYLGIGYEYRKIDMRLIPDSDLESPWEDFNYSIKDSGTTAQLGYSIALSHFYLDVGYRLRFSKPEWEGPFDIFQEGLYTKTYPIAYRQTGSLRVCVGTAF